MNHLTVTALPMDSAWADVDENLYALRTAVENIPAGTDVLVLPEMFATGFITDPGQMAGMAESDRLHPILDTLREIARRKSLAICTTVIYTPGDGKFYNRAVFVEPGGEVTTYDKRHLFSLGGEAQAYEAGTTAPPVVRFRGWNIAMAVCYDLRFPVWLRNRGLRYDALLIPANWPESRASQWLTLLTARAIENQAYVIGCNRTGKDDLGTYGNTSAAFGPDGKPLFDGNTSAVLDLEKLRSRRGHFPFYRDADDFCFR